VGGVAQSREHPRARIVRIQGVLTATVRRPFDDLLTTQGRLVKLRSEGLTWQEIDGELVILDLKNSIYLTTNAAGAVLAKLLIQDRTVDDLSGALVEEFGIENEVAWRDTEAFVAQLKDKQLLDELT